MGGRGQNHHLSEIQKYKPLILQIGGCGSDSFLPRYTEDHDQFSKHHAEAKVMSFGNDSSLFQAGMSACGHIIINQNQNQIPGKKDTSVLAKRTAYGVIHTLRPDIVGNFTATCLFQPPNEDIYTYMMMLLSITIIAVKARR